MVKKCKMRCPISKKNIEKAKNYIKTLKERKKVWQIELEKLDKRLESCADKHYQNIKKSRDTAQGEINNIDIKISEFEAVVKNGYVEI